MFDALLVYVSPVYLIVASLTVTVTYLVSALTRLPALSTFFLVFWIGMLAALTFEDMIPEEDVMAVVLVVAVSSVGIIQAFNAASLGEIDSTRSTVAHGLEFRVDGRSAHALGSVMGAALVGAALAVPLALLVAMIWERWVSDLGFTEIAMLSLVPLVLISVMHRGAMIKGLAVGALGLVIGSVGIYAITGDVRYTFGQPVLWQGLPLVVTVVGALIVPDLVWRPGARMSASRGAQFTETWVGMKDSIRPWRWSLSDPRVSVAGRQALFAVLAAGWWGGPLLAPMMSEGASAGPTPLLSSDGAILGNLQMTFFGSLSVLIASVLAVAACVFGVGLLGKISAIPRPVVAGIFASFAMLFVFVADGSYVLLLVVLGFGVLGTLMRWAGWPRVPLIAGVLAMQAIETNLESAFNIHGLGGMIARPSVIVGMLILVVIVYGYRRFAERAAGENGPARIAIVERETPGGLQLVVIAALSALGIAFLLGSFSYAESSVRALRFAGVAALALMSVQLWQEWKAGRAQIKFPPIHISRESVPLLFTAAAVVSIVLAWVMDLRWGAVAFAALAPLLLMNGSMRLVGAAIGAGVIYLVILGLDRSFFVLWS